MWGMGLPRNCKGNKKADCESWNIYCTVGFLFTFIIFHSVFTLQRPVAVVRVRPSASETLTTKYVGTPRGALEGVRGLMLKFSIVFVDYIILFTYLYYIIVFEFPRIDWNSIIIFKSFSSVGPRTEIWLSDSSENILRRGILLYYREGRCSIFCAFLY